ncbi:MAG TPA: PilZ domain-containing protein [Candidatus Angelobacter sp.]|nr:PilZ domain-containing protein [Candidatus Angelobacter sp.]
MLLQRPEPRIQISLDVKVWGMDEYGRPFVQHARTVNASSLGARLIGIDCVREGEVISLQHQDRQSRCRVVWVGRDAAKARQIGICSVEPGKTLFGASLKPLSAKAAAAPPSSFAGKPAGATRPHTARSVMPEAQGTRRSQQRFHCTGGVELRRHEGAAPVFGNLSDISLTGCYVQTVSSLPVGTEVLFMIRVRDTVVRGRAEVKASHHAVGVGLIFSEVNAGDREKLEFLIGTLAGSNELQPGGQRLLVPEDPMPATQGFSGSPRPAAQGGTSGMSVQITRTIAELNQLEQALVIDRVDPRIIAQFHDAVEHIRQTAWSAVQWAELDRSGGDPFEVLPQLEAERMHMLRKLAHNVTADLDSGSLTRYTEGISQVYEVVQALYRGLRKIVMDGAEE